MENKVFPIWISSILGMLSLLIFFFIGTSGEAVSWELVGFSTNVVLIFLCAFVSQSFNKNEGILSTPSMIYLMAVVYFVILGSIDHSIKIYMDYRFIFPHYASTGHYYIMLSILSWLGGYYLLSSILQNDNQEKHILENEWKPELIYVAIILFIISVFSFAYTFWLMDYIPFVQGLSMNASEYLRELRSDTAGKWSIITVHATGMSIILSGVCYIVFPEYRKIAITIILVEVILFSLWGARQYIIIPALILLKIEMHGKKIPLWRIAKISIIFLILFGAYAYERNRNMDAMLLSLTHDDSLISNLSIVGIGSEFRDFLSVIEARYSIEQFWGLRETALTMILPALPGTIWSIFGVEKEAMFFSSGGNLGYLIAEISRNYTWTGIRSGMLGELLIVGGAGAIIIVSLSLGMIFAYLDTQNRRIHKNDPKMLIISIFTTLLAYYFLSYVSHFSIKLWYFLYMYIFVYSFFVRPIKE